MKKLLGFTALAVAILIACGDDNGGPSAPTPTPAPPPVATPPPTPTPPTPTPPPPTSRNAKDSYTWKILSNNSNKVVVEATNVTDENHNVWLSCYQGKATEPENQTLFDSQRHSLGAGSTATFECSVPCGPGQVDLHEGAPPEPPTAWARNLIVGRPTQGDSCTPPPPPPTCDPVRLRLDAGEECGELGFELDLQACAFTCKPPPQCDVEQLRIDANDKCGELGFDLDVEACDFECKPPPPTCEELNPPATSGWNYFAGDVFVTAGFFCENDAACSLTLWAGSPNNPTRYRKANVSKNPECGESERLTIGYVHRTHSSCLWTLKASGPGLDFNQVVIDRCDN